MILGTTQGLAYADPYPVDYGAITLTPTQIVNDFIARTGIADTTITNALITLVTSLQTSGLWNKFTAIYPMVGGTALAHSQNLKDSTFPITWNGNVAHDVNGPRSEGGYGDTGINVNTMTLSDFSLSAWANYPFGTELTMIGASNGVATYQLAVAATVLYGDCHSIADGRLTTNVIVNGFSTVSRKTGSTADLLSGGGVQNTYNSAPAGGLPSFNLNLFVLAKNLNGTATQLYTNPLKFAAVGRSLVGAEGGTFNTHVVAFQTALVRHTIVEANDYLTRCSNTNGRQVSAIWYLAGQMKTNGWWANCSGMYPLLGGNATAHAQNLKSNSAPLTFVNAPTHDAYGVTGNGTTSYIQAAIPSNYMTWNSCHGIVYNRSASPTDGGAFWGAVRTTGGTCRFTGFNNGGQLGGNLMDNGFLGGSGGILGVLGLSRLTNTSGIGLVNNSNLLNNTTTNAVNNIPTQNILALARAYEGFSNDLFSNANIAFLGFGQWHDPTPFLFYSSVIQEFQRMVGRAVPDADAVSFLTRAGIVDGAQTSAVHTLVTNLKAANLWDKMTAIYPMVGGNATAHAQNLKANQYNITWVNSPSHSSSGVVGNGVSSYGDTNMLTSLLSAANFHMSVYLASSTGVLSCPAGVYNGGDTSIYAFHVDAVSTGSIQTYFDCNQITTYGRMVATFTNNFTHNIISRRSLSDASGYNRGVSKVTKLTATVNAPIGGNMYIIARNDYGVGPNVFHGGLLSFASFGQSLSDAEALAFYNIVQAFQTTLSRNIS